MTPQSIGTSSRLMIPYRAYKKIPLPVTPAPGDPIARCVLKTKNYSRLESYPAPGDPSRISL